MGARTPKIWEGKNVENSARFRTTSDFDREYLQRESRYQKSETNLIDHDPSHVEQKKMVKFGPQTKKL